MIVHCKLITLNQGTGDAKFCLHMIVHTFSIYAGGKPLPLRCNPSSSATKRVQPQKSTPKKPTRQGLRSKDTIEQLTDKEVDYRPVPASK